LSVGHILSTVGHLFNDCLFIRHLQFSCELIFLDAFQVAIFVILGIILSGAALGYWIVRKFVISKEDGSVDAGVAQFVKWAMRIIGTTLILLVCIKYSNFCF